MSPPPAFPCLSPPPPCVPCLRRHADGSEEHYPGSAQLCRANKLLNQPAKLGTRGLFCGSCPHAGPCTAAKKLCTGRGPQAAQAGPGIAAGRDWTAGTGRLHPAWRPGRPCCPAAGWGWQGRRGMGSHGARGARLLPRRGSEAAHHISAGLSNESLKLMMDGQNI